MEAMEVIDLSSDEEKSPPQNQDAAPSVVAKMKSEDLEIVSNTAKNKKQDFDEADQGPEKKRIKLSEQNDHSYNRSLLDKTNDITPHKRSADKLATLLPRSKPQIVESKPISIKSIDKNDKSSLSVEMNGNAAESVKNDSYLEDNLKLQEQQHGNRSFKINEGASSSTQIIKPHLIVKDKIKMSETAKSELSPSVELFESFLDACRSQDSSKDMLKIIAKVKKRYTNLEPSYAKSGSFIELVRQKRNFILNNRSKLYLYISHVMDEMKARQVQDRPPIEDEDEYNVQRLGTSTQTGPGKNLTLDSESLDEKDIRDRERLRTLEKAMRRCERYINKCESAEVDFDDENNSHYILAQKYKLRMVELYNKYCEITGERPDAARPYLRPKNFAVTPFPSLNNAITSFVNMKIMRMNKSLVHSKKNSGQLRFTDALFFPDYVDILNCVGKCNAEQNLLMNKSKQEVIAKDAFEQLGKHLQHCRQADFYDTFSLYLETGGCDPAKEDKELAEKLDKNQEIGTKKMAEVLADFVKKQNAAKDDENCLENKKDLETDNESSEDSDDQNSDVSTNDADKTKAEDLEPQINPKETDDKAEVVQLVDENKESNEYKASNKECDDDQDLLVVKKMTENRINLKTSEPKPDIIVDDIEITEKEDAQVILSPPSLRQTINNDIKKTGIKQITNKTAGSSDIGKSVSSPSSFPKPASTVATCKVNVVEASKTTKTSLSDGYLAASSANTIEVIDARAVVMTVKLNGEEEEKKPILRVRPFAKPPGSWKDFQTPAVGFVANTQTVGKTNSDGKIININKILPANIAKKIIQVNKPTQIGKTVQVKNDFLMDLKNKKSTVMIPPNLNKSNPHISVKTVTNNVTFNFNNQAQFQPKITSVTSHGSNPVQNVINIDKSGKIIARCRNIISNNRNAEKNSKKSNPIQTAQTNNQGITSIEIPANQVCSIGQKITGVINQGRNIESLTNEVDPLKTIVRQIPVVDGRGIKTIYQIVTQSPKTNPENIVVPGTRAVVHSQKQKPKCNVPIVADLNLEPEVLSSSPKTSSFKVRSQTSKKVDKMYETLTVD